MRSLVCLLLALLASGAAAQSASSQGALPNALPPEAEARRIPLGERTLLVTGAVGGGFGSAALVGPFAPVGSVAGLYLMGRALGLDASLKSVLGDAAWGAGAGALAGYGTFGYLTLIEGRDADISVGLGSAAVGLLVGSVTAAMLYDAAPVVLTTPDGEVVPGLTLRVGL